MYKILWLDDEFVGERKAIKFKNDLEDRISDNNLSNDVSIDVCASYERFAQYIEEKIPNVVILDVECYEKEDDIQTNNVSSIGFFKAKELADSRNIPIIVFTGKRVCDGNSDFCNSIQNCAYAIERLKGGVSCLYKALFQGYDGKKAVLIGNRFPGYSFFDSLLDHNILPLEGVVKGQKTDCVIHGILNEYKKLTKVTEENYQEVENNNIGNIRTIVEHIYIKYLINEFKDAVPFTDYIAHKHNNVNQFTLGLWKEHKKMGKDIMPDEVKLAFAYVWDGSCSFAHPSEISNTPNTSNEDNVPEIFEPVICSLQVKRMVFDSFIIVMKWFEIYKKNNLVPKKWPTKNDVRQK